MMLSSNWQATPVLAADTLIRPSASAGVTINVARSSAYSWLAGVASPGRARVAITVPMKHSQV